MSAAMSRLERQLVDVIRGKRKQVPEAGKLLWQWFRALSDTRPVGMAACAITYAEIQAFAQGRAIPMSPAHVQIIRAMDRALMDKWRSEDSTAPGVAGSAPPLSRQELTAASFDAVFS